MSGEPVLAHARIVDEAAFHHIPTERALQSAEHENSTELPDVRAVKLSSQQEIQKRHQENKTDGATQQTMPVFPPENAFEILKAHAEVDLLVFGGLPVFLKCLLPCLLRERRQRADERLPFDDRQAGVREARDASHHDQREKYGAAQQKPCGDLLSRSLVHSGWVPVIAG